MSDNIKLKNHVLQTFQICSREADSLFDQTSKFHDADLLSVFSNSEEHLSIEIRYPHWFFLEATGEFDRITSFRFDFYGVIFSTCWGSDEEICRSMIYNFFVAESKFQLDTGDGGRHGKFIEAKSTVEIATTKEVIDLMK